MGWSVLGCVGGPFYYCQGNCQLLIYNPSRPPSPAEKGGGGRGHGGLGVRDPEGRFLGVQVPGKNQWKELFSEVRGPALAEIVWC